MRSHPELGEMIAFFTAEALRKKPENLFDFASGFFTSVSHSNACDRSLHLLTHVARPPA